MTITCTSMSRMLAVLTIILIPGILSSLEIEGYSLNGLHFKGLIQETRETELRIRNVENETQPVIGIPFSEVKSIRLSGKKRGLALLRNLSAQTEILPLLEQESLNITLEAIHALSEKRSWPEMYQWTIRILAASPTWEVARRLRLCQAWACHEMKLFAEAGEILEELEIEWDALEAPVLLCWLMAKMEYMNGSGPKALYWSLLPSMQIPASEDPIARELADLSIEWLNKASPNLKTKLTK